MNKLLYKGISLFSGIIDPHYEIDENVKFDFSQDKLFDILNEIFSVDERSGLPKGDIQYYLSAEGNPEVKNWLELNLLQPRSVKSGTSLEGVTDDLIAEMSRGSDESIEDYVGRLASIRDEVIENLDNQ